MVQDVTRRNCARLVDLRWFFVLCGGPLCYVRLCDGSLCYVVVHCLMSGYVMVLCAMWWSSVLC